MLRLAGGQAESLFDQLLPVEVRELPQDLAVVAAIVSAPSEDANVAPCSSLSASERPMNPGPVGNSAPLSPIASRAKASTSSA